MQKRAIIALDQRVAAIMLERMLPDHGLEHELWTGSFEELTARLLNSAVGFMFVSAVVAGELAANLATDGRASKAHLPIVWSPRLKEHWPKRGCRLSNRRWFAISPGRPLIR